MATMLKNGTVWMARQQGSGDYRKITWGALHDGNTRHFEDKETADHYSRYGTDGSAVNLAMRLTGEEKDRIAYHIDGESWEVTRHGSGKDKKIFWGSKCNGEFRMYPVKEDSENFAKYGSDERSE